MSNWIFIIAIATIVNTFSLIYQQGYILLIGLTIPEGINGAGEAFSRGNYSVMYYSWFAQGLFMMFYVYLAYLSRKASNSAYNYACIIYFIDTVLLAIVSWWSALFIHLFLLIYICNGRKYFQEFAKRAVLQCDK